MKKNGVKAVFYGAYYRDVFGAKNVIILSELLNGEMSLAKIRSMENFFRLATQNLSENESFHNQRCLVRTINEIISNPYRVRGRKGDLNRSTYILFTIALS